MRYAVKEVRGIAMGEGMFQVVDENDGVSVGEPCYWRDEAERRAGALNRADEQQSDYERVNGTIVNALQAEVDALRKDAERYRWLRANGRGESYILWDYQGEELDRIIDAEISREKGAND